MDPHVTRSGPEPGPVPTEPSDPESGATAGKTGRLRVLHVEDSEDDSLLLRHQFRRSGYEADYLRVDNLSALHTAVVERQWDVILSDHGLPGFDADDALRTVRQTGCDAPFIIVSGQIGELAAVAAMKAGAQDYVGKDNLSRLVPAVEREVREAELRRQHRETEAEGRKAAHVSAVLARVGREVIAALDPRLLPQRLCALTTEVLEAQSSTTVLWQPEADVFVQIASYGVRPEEEANARLVPIPAQAIQSLLDRFRGEDVLEAEGGGALADVVVGSRCLYIALHRGEKLIGLQVVERHPPAAPFSDVERRIAAGFAQLATLALERARMVEEVEEANRLKSQFVANMSHELRTPLNIILGYNDLLLDSAFGPINLEQENVLRQVERSARSLLELVCSILDLERLESERSPVHARSIDPVEFFAKIAAEVRERYQKPGVELEWDVARDLPPIHSDPEKLGGALKKIVDNAFKFTEEGKVRVEMRSAGGMLEIGVSDTGIGIDRTALPIIFEPFRQVDGASTRQHSGVGLGLHMARRLIEMIGGSITVESEPDRGSTFRVRIPLRGGQRP